MENIARSRKSRIKKRSEDWESMKVEIAKELGLWPKVAENGWAAQVALESLKPAADGVLTVALAQPRSVSWVITFAFVGLETFTSIAAFLLLLFLKVEKTIGSPVSLDWGFVNGVLYILKTRPLSA